LLSPGELALDQKRTALRLVMANTIEMDLLRATNWSGKKESLVLAMTSRETDNESKRNMSE
jgi:hypothetical protein